jgi:hypothetical protein
MEFAGKCPHTKNLSVNQLYSEVLCGLVVNVLVIGPKFRGFKPGRGWWAFKGDKNPHHAFFRRESKAVGPI